MLAPTSDSLEVLSTIRPLKTQVSCPCNKLLDNSNVTKSQTVVTIPVFHLLALLEANVIDPDMFFLLFEDNFAGVKLIVNMQNHNVKPWFVV